MCCIIRCWSWEQEEVSMGKWTVQIIIYESQEWTKHKQTNCRLTGGMEANKVTWCQKRCGQSDGHHKHGVLPGVLPVVHYTPYTSIQSEQYTQSLQYTVYSLYSYSTVTVCTLCSLQYSIHNLYSINSVQYEVCTLVGWSVCKQIFHEVLFLTCNSFRKLTL